MSVYAVTQPYGVGLGQQLPFRMDNPAAGADAVRSFDGYGVRRLLSLVFTLVTDANAANRYVTVEYRGKDGNAFSVNGPATVVTANSTERYAGSIAYHVSDFAAGTDLFFPLDPVFVFPGDQLVIHVASAQAGDQLSAIRGVEERFPLNEAVLPVLQSE